MNQIKRLFPIESVTRCLICNFERQIICFYGSDDRFGYSGEFPVVECPNCGLSYLSKRIDANYIGDLYDQYYKTRSKISPETCPSLWRSKLKKLPFIPFLYNTLFGGSYNLYDFLRFKKNIRVLDVGSGFIPSEAKRIIRQGGQWISVEVDQEISRSLQNLGLATYCGTLEEFSTTNPQSFDYIILSQIIEHIYNPQQFLGIAKSLLTQGGEIIIACPNYDSFLKKQYGHKWIHWHVPYHVAHYNRFTLAMLAKSTKMQIKRFYTATPFPWYYAQLQLGKGLPYNSSWFGKFPIEKPLLDLRLMSKHRSHQGDILVAILNARKLV